MPSQLTSTSTSTISFHICVLVFAKTTQLYHQLHHYITNYPTAMLPIIVHLINSLFRFYQVLQLYQTMCLLLSTFGTFPGFPIFSMLTGMLLASLFPSITGADLIFYGGIFISVYWFVYTFSGVRLRVVVETEEV
jgi:hypothetical protein